MRMGKAATADTVGEGTGTVATAVTVDSMGTAGTAMAVAAAAA